jgi:DUF4097 and DUF4098 domain-containing protein YvlB
MSEERLRILHMLSEGKLTPDEAEKLLSAMEKDFGKMENIRETQPGDIRISYHRES